MQRHAEAHGSAALGNMRHAGERSEACSDPGFAKITRVCSDGRRVRQLLKGSQTRGNMTAGAGVHGRRATQLRKREAKRRINTANQRE
jgi:hypothetical protein